MNSLALFSWFYLFTPVAFQTVRLQPYAQVHVLRVFGVRLFTYSIKER
jgi:hypothetical protein